MKDATETFSFHKAVEVTTMEVRPIYRGSLRADRVDAVSESARAEVRSFKN
jgi:hypothetical protein